MAEISSMVDMLDIKKRKNQKNVDFYDDDDDQNDSPQKKKKQGPDEQPEFGLEVVKEGPISQLASELPL